MTVVSAQASLSPSIASAPSPTGRQFAPQPFVGVPRCGDQSSRYPLPQYGPSRWSTLRFRRAKDQKGWVLLGIPLSLYSLVVQRLFEEQAKFIAKYRVGGFVNLLFEAPQTLAATLAMTFPAPPGAEPLVVNEKGDRILSGSSLRSEKARIQTIATA
ncbi:MAG: hypothetical protein ACO3NK_05525 [Prochlorotrichaceae cyanobacterium]